MMNAGYLNSKKKMNGSNSSLVSVSDDGHLEIGGVHYDSDDESDYDDLIGGDESSSDWETYTRSSDSEGGWIVSDDDDDVDDCSEYEPDDDDDDEDDEVEEAVINVVINVNTSDYDVKQSYGLRQLDDRTSAELCAKKNIPRIVRDFLFDSVEYVLDDRCVVCLELEPRVTCLPCKHRALCSACYRGFAKCPVCRSNIQCNIVRMTPLLIEEKTTTTTTLS